MEALGVVSMLVVANIIGNSIFWGAVFTMVKWQDRLKARRKAKEV